MVARKHHIPVVYSTGPQAENGGQGRVAQGQHHNGVETFRVLPSGRFLREPTTLFRLFSWGGFGQTTYNTIKGVYSSDQSSRFPRLR